MRLRNFGIIKSYLSFLWFFARPIVAQFFFFTFNDKYFIITARFHTPLSLWIECQSYGFRSANFDTFNHGPRPTYNRPLKSTLFVGYLVDQFKWNPFFLSLSIFYLLSGCFYALNVYIILIFFRRIFAYLMPLDCPSLAPSEYEK